MHIIEYYMKYATPPTNFLTAAQAACLKKLLRAA